MDSKSAAVKAMQLIGARKIDDATLFLNSLSQKGLSLGPYSQQVCSALIASFPWDVVSKLLPRQCNFFVESGWVKSLADNMPVDNRGTPIPWLNYSVLDFIFPRLKDKPSVFEWGSGYSTLWWASLGGKVLSIEDSESWYDKISRDTNGVSNLEIKLCKNKDSYVNAITESWDVIQIDGSYRNECAAIAQHFLRPDGFILFDNSDSPEFSNGIMELNNQGFFRIDFYGLIPTLPYKNCTSIFIRDFNLLRNQLPPNEQKSLPGGISCFQSILGIQD